MLVHTNRESGQANLIQTDDLPFRFSLESTLGNRAIGAKVSPLTYMQA